MSNFENGTLRIRELPNSTQSFEKMFDEMADNNTDTASINTELFELSPNYNAETDGTNRVDKTTDSFTVKIAKSMDITNSTLNGDIEHNDSNLSSIHGQCRIDSGNMIFDRCSSTQESLCTECRCDNRLNSLLASNNNTQLLTQSSCLQCEMENLYNEEKSLQKRSLSLTPEKRKSDFNMEQFFPSGKCLKKFKSEGCTSTIKNAGSNICKLSIQNLTNIDQPVEPFATFCSSSEVNEVNDCSKHAADLEIPFSKLSDYGKGSSHLSLPHQVNSDKLEQAEWAISSPKENTEQDVTQTLIDENLSTDKSNHSSLNERITSQSQNLDTNESKYSSSTLSQSTIEEIYYIDVADDIGCLTNAKAICEISEYQRTEEKSPQSIINDDIIQGEEIFGTTVMDLDLKPLTNLMPNEINMRENNPLSLSCRKDLESEIYAVNDAKAAVDPKFQCLNESQLKWIEKEDGSTAKVHPIDVSVTDADSKFRNEEIFKVPDDSVLEITIESDFECIVKQDKVIKSGKINSAHAVEDLKKNSTNSKTVAKDKKGTKNGPIDLTVNTNSNPAENVIPLKDMGAENDGFDNSFLTDLELVNIEKQIGMAMKEVNSVNPTANITSIKDPNISSETFPSRTNDFSLEFLSESELQRIEEDAYIKAKETSAINFMNVNTESLANKQDVFYRPEQLNIINENTNDDLVIPNWVTNPAPEPNYDKIKQAVQKRRKYIQNMLREIIRLSNIISKVGSIVYAEHQSSDSEAVPKSSSQIQDSRKIHSTEENGKNPSVEIKASGNACGNSVTADSKDNDIFYVPQSNRSKYNAPPSIVPAPANTATIITNDLGKNLEGNGEFYTPQLNRFKHDIPPIFNHRNEIRFNGENVSYVQSNASNIFGTLKHDFNGNRTCESDISSVWYRGRVNETGIQDSRSDSYAVLKNKDNFGNRMKTEHHLPKIVSNGTITVRDETGLRMNKVEPVYNDTIFYLPDKLSSGSNNYTVLPGRKNSKTLSAVNFTKLPSANIKVDEPRPLNFGKSSAARVINNDSIFYNGNNI